LQLYLAMSFVLALALSCIASPVVAEVGCYEVVQTHEYWRQNYPTGIPNNDHYSGMAVIMHTSAYSASTVGSAASAGLKSLAETGSSTTLTSEVSASAAAMSLVSLPPMIAPGSSQTASPNTKKGFATTQIEVDSAFPMVSLLTMIAPSPDWYAYGSATLFENGGFQAKTIDLIAYDAGTDSGTTYAAANSVTSTGTVQKLMSGVAGPSTTSTSDRIMMQMTFTPKCCYTGVQTQMDHWTSTYTTNLPNNPHYSGMLVGISSGTIFGTIGSTASAGLKALAETGNTATLKTETDAMTITPAATSLMASKVLTVQAGTGQTVNPNTKRMFMNFRMMVHTSYPHISMATMIAPSPDWYAYATTNLMASGTWQTRAMSLIAYDAGTDSGTAYTSADMVTTGGTIAKLTTGIAPATGDRTMFTMTMTPDPTCNRMVTTTTVAPSPVTSGTRFAAVLSWVWLPLAIAARQFQ
jgi:hypothetical protein